MGWGERISPCFSRTVAELQSESLLQPQSSSSPQRPHTGRQRRGSARGWEASLCFLAGVGRDAPRWPQGLGHCGPVLMGPRSVLSTPTARLLRSHALRRVGSLGSAPFPLEASNVFHLHGFSSFFFSFNIFFNVIFAVRLKSFLRGFVCASLFFYLSPEEFDQELPAPSLHPRQH